MNAESRSRTWSRYGRAIRRIRQHPPGAPVAAKGWARRFEDPIPLPDGRVLVTLREAADYILKLSKRQTETDHWQLALHCLIEAAEDREPLLHARVAMLKALNHGKPAPISEPRRKRAKSYRIL